MIRANNWRPSRLPRDTYISICPLSFTALSFELFSRVSALSGKLPFNLCRLRPRRTWEEWSNSGRSRLPVIYHLSYTSWDRPILIYSNVWLGKHVRPVEKVEAFQSHQRASQNGHCVFLRERSRRFSGYGRILPHNERKLYNSLSPPACKLRGRDGDNFHIRPWGKKRRTKKRDALLD